MQRAHPNHRLRRRHALTGLLALALSSQAAWSAQAGIRTVSPGALDGVPPVTSTCPTFSWTLPSSWTQGGSRESERLTSADTVILEIYRWQADPEAARGTAEVPQRELQVEALHGVESLRSVRLPVHATSWTPSPGRCLEAGAAYSWTIASDEALEAPVRDRFFRVGMRPSPAEVAWAQDVLRRFLETGERQGAAQEGRRADRRSADLARPRDSAPLQSAPLESAGTTSTEEGTRGGSTVSLRVDGVVEARAISVEAAVPYAGNVVAQGSIVSTGAIAGNRLEVSGPDQFSDRSSFVSNDSGVQLCTAGVDDPLSDCELGLDSANGTLTVGSLWVVGTIDARGGIDAPRGSWRGSGGSGYFEVPSATFTRVDDNASTCPPGGVVVGVRLAETDSDQIGVQVLCTN